MLDPLHISVTCACVPVFGECFCTACVGIAGAGCCPVQRCDVKVSLYPVGNGREGGIPLVDVISLRLVVMGETEGPTTCNWVFLAYWCGLGLGSLLCLLGFVLTCLGTTYAVRDFDKMARSVPS